MSIEQKTPTSWECTYAAGDYNESYDIEATSEGLEIDYDTLEWEQIDAARMALGWPADRGMRTAIANLSAALGHPALEETDERCLEAALIRFAADRLRETKE